MTMCRHSFHLRTLMFVATAACASGVLAASPGDAATAQARYRQDMAVCNSGQSNQDRTTCRQEASHALAEARRGGLNDAPGQYQQNAVQRCAAHKDDDRRACEARMMAPAGVDGSVSEGGIMRESITVTPAN